MISCNLVQIFSRPTVTYYDVGLYISEVARKTLS